MVRSLTRKTLLIPIDYIIELGLIRKRNECANCGKKMDVPNYHIQLCKKCRLIFFDTWIKEQQRKERVEVLNNPLKRYKQNKK